MSFQQLIPQTSEKNRSAWLSFMEGETFLKIIFPTLFSLFLESQHILAFVFPCYSINNWACCKSSNIFSTFSTWVAISCHFSSVEGQHLWTEICLSSICQKDKVTQQWAANSSFPKFLVLAGLHLNLKSNL